ncbi:unnamed protein product [Kuraishia capsulata CBS 1993]|uniref:Uncharacterized protein n=1 Tax=Kuraishia capsulata CBS 1993 TaxID=1382522 RepID=W6MNS5_9ASCO|nr:uncharacterized protein KUCA_T00002686001 [Kuraishia capsulata CBS 1993]CDK26712.1 unnamed protein product [Kuraishia capsulata CBS 1993]
MSRSSKSSDEVYSWHGDTPIKVDKVIKKRRGPRDYVLNVTELPIVPDARRVPQVQKMGFSAPSVPVVETAAPNPEKSETVEEQEMVNPLEQDNLSLLNMGIDSMTNRSTDPVMFKHEFAPDSEGLVWLDPHTTFSESILAAYRNYLKAVIRQDDGAIMFNDLKITKAKRVPQLRFPVIIQIQRARHTVPLPDEILLRYGGFMGESGLHEKEAPGILCQILATEEAEQKSKGQESDSTKYTKEEAVDMLNKLYEPESNVPPRIPIKKRRASKPAPFGANTRRLLAAVNSRMDFLNGLTRTHREEYYTSQILKLDDKLSTLCSRYPEDNPEFAEIAKDLAEARDYELLRLEYSIRYRRNQATKEYYSNALESYRQTCESSVTRLVKLKNFLTMQKHLLQGKETSLDISLAKSEKPWKVFKSSSDGGILKLEVDQPIVTREGTITSPSNSVQNSGSEQSTSEEDEMSKRKVKFFKVASQPLDEYSSMVTDEEFQQLVAEDAKTYNRLVNHYSASMGLDSIQDAIADFKATEKVHSTPMSFTSTSARHTRASRANLGMLNVITQNSDSDASEPSTTTPRSPRGELEKQQPLFGKPEAAQMARVMRKYTAPAGLGQDEIDEDLQALGGLRA